MANIKTKILRIYVQGWDENLQPLEYLKSKGIEVVKYTYSNFGGCYFFEVVDYKVDIDEKIEVLDTPANKFNWSV